MCMACAGIPFGPYHRVALGAVLARTRGMLRDVLARATPADLNDTSIGVYARLRPGGEAGTEVEVKITYKTPRAIYAIVEGRRAQSIIRSLLRATLVRFGKKMEGMFPEDDQLVADRIAEELAE